MKWKMSLVLCLAAPLLLGACSDSSDDNGGADVQPIVIGMGEDVLSLDPATAYTSASQELLTHINSGLYLVNADSSLRPGLAVGDPRISNQGKEYVIELRQGLKFADGTACKAQCFKDSIDRAIAVDGDPAFLITDFVQSVETVDEYKLKFVLKKAVGFFQSVLVNHVYTPTNASGYARDAELNIKSIADPTKLLGLGPYRIEALKYEGTGDEQRVSEIDLVANPAYYGPAPKAKKLMIKYYGLKAGNQPIMDDLKAKKLDLGYRYLMLQEVREQLPELTMKEGYGLYTQFIGFRCNQPPFNDAKLRRAVGAALSRKPITEGLLAGMAKPLYTMVPQGMWSHKPVLQDIHGDEGNLESRRIAVDRSGLQRGQQARVRPLVLGCPASGEDGWHGEDRSRENGHGDREHRFETVE